MSRVNLWLSLRKIQKGKLPPIFPPITPTKGLLQKMHQENHPIPGHNKRALNAPKPNPVSKGTIMHKPYL